MTRARIYAEVAALHASSIPHGFLPKLGTGFLEELYRCIDEDRSTFLEVCEERGRVVGFVAGTIGQKPLRSILCRHPVRVAWQLMPSLISPARFTGMLSIGRYASSGAGLPPGLPNAELLSIAVDPGVRGKGHAERLFGALERRMREAGVDRFRIIAGDSLKAACRFYLKMGAEQVAEVEIHAGARSLVFCKSLTPERPEASP